MVRVWTPRTGLLLSETDPGTPAAETRPLATLKKDIAAALSAGEFLWVDLEAPTSEETALLREIFHFHPLAIEDCEHRLQRPKLDEYPGYLFLVLHGVPQPAREHREPSPSPPPLPDGRVATKRLYLPEEFDLFLGEHYLVIYHKSKGDLPWLAETRARYQGEPALAERGIPFLLHYLLDALFDAYFPLLDRIEENLNRIEDRVFLAPDQKLLSQAFGLRREILRIRKSLSGAREVIAMLLRHEEIVTPQSRAYFLDVYDHTLRLFDLVDNHHDLLAAVLDAYLSSVSNRTNEIMKVLTVITTIMMPLSFLAGIYGMNFRYMPELNWRWGYPAVLLLMALITAGMVWFFRRKRWL